ENIHYIRPEATEEEVWEAAEAAEIADLMRERKGAPVGPKGAQLSGGQKQRIAIARAFLRAAPVVILDEATSALDQKTEARVMRALDRLAEGRTTIMVSHRMSSVMGADRIYVLESGKLVEDGTHEELMARGQLYATMFEAQRSGYD
ncbi:MAG: ATP-binding cassette domain-containing protein, partial [Pseudomonadota bacterium]